VEITDLLIPEIEKGTTDFICLNYANADMVGHTGVFTAAIRAVETVDACVKRVVTAALEKDYTILVTADHGNADYMINEDGSPNTAHTLNPVPLIFVDKNYRGKLDSGKLGDLAPTILRWMALPVPTEMTGICLIEK
jgi:2,3-bisphosphoglycerate-independent phosphoglycerate mutase